jgi:hypothetical protein
MFKMRVEIAVLKPLDDVFEKAVKRLGGGYVAVVVLQDLLFSGCREAFLESVEKALGRARKRSDLRACLFTLFYELSPLFYKLLYHFL